MSIREKPVIQPDEQEDTFLRRWSRRKRLAEDDTPAMAPATADEGADRPESPPPLTDADMPPLDSLNADSDFTPFLSPGVSDGLRKVALRKLFLGGAFNLPDGLDDYDDDFRHFEALGDVITADMRHQLELEQQRLAEQTETETETEKEVDESEREGVMADSPEQADDDLDPVAQAASDEEPDSGVTEDKA